MKIKFDIAKILMSLCMIALTAFALTGLSFAAWDGTAAESFSGGNGSKESPFLVGNASELALVAKLVNSPDTHGEYSESYYMQIADIDLSDVLWDPIGVGALQASKRIDIYPFFGVYDGNGFSVSGLLLDGAPSVTWTKYTLATVTVNGTTYDMYTTDYQPIYEPSLDSDGLPVVDENGNPVYESSQKTSVRSIGLFGYNCGKIKNVTLIEPEVAAGFNKAVAGAISGVSAKRKLYQGKYDSDGNYLRTDSVTVSDTGVVENCKVIGGSVSLCENPSVGGTSSASTGTYNCLGAIAGFIEAASISDCFSSASISGTAVTGDTTVGAIVGRSGNISQIITSYTKNYITRCTAFSDISVTCAESSMSIHYAGGILGNGNCDISQCCFDGNISFGGGGSISLVSVGGIVGWGEVNTSVSTTFSSGNLCAADLTEAGGCSVRAGGICGSGSIPDGIGTFTMCNISANGIISPPHSGATVSASSGNYSSSKHENIYYDSSSVFEVNGTAAECPTGTKSNILFAPQGDLSCATSFKDYFDEVKTSDWQYTTDVSRNVIFRDCFTTDGTTHIVNTDGEYLSFEGEDEIILPYGITAVAADAFDGVNTDGISRIIVPSSVDSESKALINELFPEKTVVLYNSTADKLFSTIGTELYGDFLVTDTGTVKLYVGLYGASTVLPENAEITATSGLYSSSTPSTVRVHESFNPAYLSYLGTSSAEVITLIIPPDTDFADYCNEAEVEFALLGDLDGDKMVSLSDLSAFLKYIQGAYETAFSDVCDLLYDGSVDINDLRHFMHYFADTSVTLGEGN